MYLISRGETIDSSVLLACPAPGCIKTITLRPRKPTKARPDYDEQWREFVRGVADPYSIKTEEYLNGD